MQQYIFIPWQNNIWIDLQTGHAHRFASVLQRKIISLRRTLDKHLHTFSNISVSVPKTFTLLISSAFTVILEVDIQPKKK